MIVASLCGEICQERTPTQDFGDKPRKFRFISEACTHKGFSWRRSCRRSRLMRCAEKCCVFMQIGAKTKLFTSSAPSGHLLLKEKALVPCNIEVADKSEFWFRVWGKNGGWGDLQNRRFFAKFTGKGLIFWEKIAIIIPYNIEWGFCREVMQNIHFMEIGGVKRGFTPNERI